MSVWGNPLARGTDRTEAVAAMIALGIWLFALPIVVVAGLLLRADMSALVADEQHARTQDSAVLLEDAPSYLPGADGIAAAQPQVRAVWTTPDGTEHTGTVPANPGDRAGDRLTVWVDRTGSIADAPLNGTMADTVAIMATAGAWLLLGAALGVGWFVLRWTLNKRRSANWERDWREFGPLWSGR